MKISYDVIVIGAGHAGCEAALAASRMGASTALVTMSKNSVAKMSCNPSVGGIGKSQLVCELDALGGEIGVNSDYTGIQFRTLNTRKGPAVRSFRIQCDKAAFSSRMSAILINTKNLTIIEDIVTDIFVEKGILAGVIARQNNTIYGKAVVIATGTFLNGTIHIGSKSIPGGRSGEPSATELGASLKRLGISIGRFKTGTPPRIDIKSVNFSEMTIQPGECPPSFLSTAARSDHAMFHVEHESPPEEWLKQLFHVEQYCEQMRPWVPGSDQVPCFLTQTTPESHDIISKNLLKSSLYGGYITSTGVRYCPSIEDKIVKFPDRQQHHVFIEPEGRLSKELYPNGISNSLPEHVQKDLVRSIPGLERAVITQFGYGIEYDYSDPTQLTHTLESKQIERLYFAGQINGTTGYEEAAAQGFIAGVNAVRKIRGETRITFERHESYIGVMLDDLVTKGIDEPYRMFTSRSEHRLLLRQDNAVFRMADVAGEIGIVAKDFLETIRSHERMIRDEMDRLSNERSDGCTLLQVLRRPNTRYVDLPNHMDFPAKVIEQLEIWAAYQGYIDREQDHIRVIKSRGGVVIPPSIDYQHLSSIRYEARVKLEKVRPETIGQASRIPGVTPADISILSVIIKQIAGRR